MKKLTSVTMHTTGEGQRLSYTYSEVDEDSGAVVRENVRDSLVVLDTLSNSTVLSAIKAVNDFVSEKMGE